MHCLRMYRALELAGGRARTTINLTTVPRESMYSASASPPVARNTDHKHNNQSSDQHCPRCGMLHRDATLASQESPETTFRCHSTSIRPPSSALMLAHIMINECQPIWLPMALHFEHVGAES